MTVLQLSPNYDGSCPFFDLTGSYHMTGFWTFDHPVGGGIDTSASYSMTGNWSFAGSTFSATPSVSARVDSPSVLLANTLATSAVLGNTACVLSVMASTATVSANALSLTSSTDLTLDKRWRFNRKVH